MAQWVEYQPSKLVTIPFKPSQLFTDGIYLFLFEFYTYILHVPVRYSQQKHDEQFNSIQLVKMALGVAKGMEYLSGIGFVHRVS